MQATDLILDENQDLQIAFGDFVIDYSDEQHISHILIADKGSFREHPLLGVGIIRWMNAPKRSDAVDLRNKIASNLKYDNMVTISIEVTNDNVNINAQRIK